MSEYHFDPELRDKKKNKKQEVLKRIRDREIEDIKKILTLPEGRRFLWKLLSESGVFRSSFTGNSQTFFNEGKREIGLLVLDEVMKADPGKFTQMQNESINEQKKLSREMEIIDGK